MTLCEVVHLAAPEGQLEQALLDTGLHGGSSYCDVLQEPVQERQLETPVALAYVPLSHCEHADIPAIAA